MSQPSRISTAIRDFPGLATNIDPHDARPGAADEQVNVQSSQPGVLEVRPGYAVVQFDAE
jgi:hypothetical protein